MKYDCFRCTVFSFFSRAVSSVADPDLLDPYVLGLPDPDPLVKDMDPYPDSSIIKQK